MKKLLLMMPFFMGYEKSLSQALCKQYDITLINSDEYDNNVLFDYRKCSKAHWLLRHLSKHLEKYEKERTQSKYDELILRQINRENDYYDVIFCINGGYVSEALFFEIREKNPKAKYVYYAWDDVGNLFSADHIGLFDHIFSFNMCDCRLYDWSYLPMFVQGEFIGHKEDLYDIAYIGTAHSDRIKIANKLKHLYSNKYRLYLFLYDSKLIEDGVIHNTPLSYDEYLDVLSHSRTVLDIPAEIQEGPTTRVFDALLTKTKVISSNKKLELYPVFSENICIVDRNELKIDEAFMMKEYFETDYRSLSVHQWLQEIGIM